MLTRLPAPVRVVMGALRFRSPDLAALESLSDSDWRCVLEFTDRAQITLLTGAVLGEHLPAGVRARIAADHYRNLTRLSKLRGATFELVDRLEGAAVPYALLKGFTHGSDYAPAPDVRPQYDIDLYVPPESLALARECVASLGYEPLAGMEDFPTDHLPVMVRKTGWQWRGDCYDPEIPPSVDLHFRLWDADTERFGCPGIEEFHQRRIRTRISGREVTAFHPADMLGYAALHLLRHMLRGSLRIYHVYEIAHFLERRARDADFWECWERLHPAELRRLETIVFELARCWFDCALPPQLEPLAPQVRLWMDHWALAPLEGMFRPDKRELWLHLALLERWKDQRPVLLRRIAPLQLPGPVDSVFVPERELTFRLRMRRRWRYSAHLAHRFSHHSRALPSLCADGARWWWMSGAPGKPLLLFLAASNTFGFGVTVFVLLYNLVLLDAGYREDFLGLASGAMTLGSIGGALLAPHLTRCFGLWTTVRSACVISALIFAARALIVSSAGALAAAFLSGVGLACWMTSLPPSIAALTSERRRPLGFSLWVGSGIATGITGGLVGSRLPEWLHRLGLADTGMSSKQAGIVCGCAIALLSPVWLARVRLPEAAARVARTVYPWTSFLKRYLVALGVWSLAIGSFNPFFNAFFSRRLGASLAEIGVLFSVAQTVQVLATAAAPIIVGRLGLAAGTAAMQVGTAAALTGMALAPSPAVAAAFYTVFMSLQVMCEPGLFSLPMNRVSPEERPGASGLTFLVMFAAQVLAAAAAGWGLANIGYPAVMTAAALTALVAAALFARLLSAPNESPASRPSEMLVS